jgi:glutamine cyclotransferase
VAVLLLTAMHLKQPIKSLAAAVRRFGIPKRKPIIVRVLEHDPQAFTLGLAYHNGHLYESTGLEGRSSLRRLNPASGEVEAMVPLEQGWGEGIAIVEDTLVQLTWKSGVARAYAIEDLRKVGDFAYDGEGWGLASAEGSFIMSNGSDVLCFRDREFSVQRRLPVKLRGSPVELLNDLEHVNGQIYANVLHDNHIYEISAQSGRVTKIIDCSELVALAKPASASAVMNGIAYNPSTGSFFLTGKNWTKLFEVLIPD